MRIQNKLYHMLICTQSKFLSNLLNLISVHTAALRFHNKDGIHMQLTQICQGTMNIHNSTLPPY